jgi:tetratricopeptide (TPR) repeat protein
MRIKHRIIVSALVLLAMGSADSFANGGGMMGGGSRSGLASPTQPRSPLDQVIDAYNSGVRYVNKAKDYENDAAKAASDDKRTKALDKARTAYSSALDQFKQAVGKKPDLFQAWNYIGFSQRHLGDYESALMAYERALELNPAYAEAVEYRAEAYLGLNRIEDAKSSYMRLFRDTRPLAAELMTAMRRWIDERQRDSKGVNSDDLSAFAKWVDERVAIAQQTASLEIGRPKRPLVDWK